MNKLKLLPLLLGVIALVVTHQGTVAGPDTKAAAASTAGLAELAKAELPPAPAPEVTPEPEPAPEVKPEPNPAAPKRPDPKPGYRYECGPYGCKLVPILPSTTVEAAPVQSCEGGQCYTQPSVRYQPVRRGWFSRWRR